MSRATQYAPRPGTYLSEQNRVDHCPREVTQSAKPAWIAAVQPTTEAQGVGGPHLPSLDKVYWVQCVANKHCHRAVRGGKVSVS